MDVKWKQRFLITRIHKRIKIRSRLQTGGRMIGIDIMRTLLLEIEGARIRSPFREQIKAIYITK